MSSDGTTIKVAVRVRPLVESERNRGCQSILQKTPTVPQIVVSSGIKTNEMYTFNFVFAPEDSQETVYENAVKTMVMKLFKGYNVTILAYGQTGSGKTHTMGTTYDGVVSEEMGVIPRAITDIFQEIDDTADEYEFSIHCAFVELYQEKLYDLLSTNAREQSVVDIREDNGKVVIPNLTEVKVNDALETTDCLIRASSERAVGATAMNAHSSRSHAIFTITVEKIPKNNRSGATIAKFHLVDLAGSERSKKTGATGEQFKEGVKINQGLLALGNVISTLGSGNHGHVSYRDSKLTRLLQDSLGGNSETLMVACVSPADYNMEETLGTLRYADRAKKIKNKPIVNEDPKQAEINRLRAELQSMRVELMAKSSFGGGSVDKCKNCDEPPTKEFLQKQLREMAEKMQISLSEMAHREHVITEYEETVDSLNAQIASLKDQISSLDVVNMTEMTPEQLKRYHENVQTLTTTISNLNDHMNERKECILQSSKASEHQLFNNTYSLENPGEEFGDNNEKYIEKQSNHQQELREIRQELEVKEKLHEKLFANYQKFCTLNDEQNIATKFQDYEKAIVKLEKEREELKELLRNKNGTISVKLAEERRKRVQQLETEISDIKKKNKNQELLLKQREKDGDQIKKLNSEIQEMKQLKVRLIRKMKAESDEFRQWRADQAKELIQLRAKGRKMQTEAAKKNALHEKQHNVLRRKFEQSTAANKRLQDALLRIKKAQESKTNNNKTTSHRSISWLNEELEVITSIVDIKQSHDTLIEARAELTSRLAAAKRQKPLNSEYCKSLEKDIEMHNAQIAECREKITTNELEAKYKTICDAGQSLPDCRNISKHLLNYIADNRNQFNVYFAQARDFKQMLAAEKEEKLNMEREYKKKIDEMAASRNQLESQFEEKTALLLKSISSQGAPDEKIELLQEKLAEREAEIEKLKSQQGGVKRKPKSRIQQIQVCDDSIVSIGSEIDIDDSDEDPDWRCTPISKRRPTRSMSTNSNENDKSNNVTALKATSSNSSNTRQSKNGKKLGCGCKTGCKQGMCGCRKSAFACNEHCACKETCQNVFNGKKAEDEASSLKRERSEELFTESDDDDENKENEKTDGSFVATPAKKQLSSDSDVHPYVYSVKKRARILDADSSSDNN